MDTGTIIPFISRKESLENVQSEMVTGVVPLLRRIKINPRLVVCGDLHFSRIAMIHVRSALIVFRGPVIVRIIYIWIMIKPLPILCIIGICPLLTIRLLRRNRIGEKTQAKRTKSGKDNRTEHNFNLLNSVDGVTTPCSRYRHFFSRTMRK